MLHILSWVNHVLYSEFLSLMHKSSLCDHPCQFYQLELIRFAALGLHVMEFLGHPDRVARDSNKHGNVSPAACL